MINTIEKNPYRIIDLLPTSSERDIQRQRQKLSTFAKIGKPIPNQLDFSFLPIIPKTEVDIQKAFSSIELNDNKILFALFWFVEINAFDATVIDNLKTGNVTKAETILFNLVSNKEVSENNYPSFNNLSTYLMMKSSTLKDLKRGVDLKINLISSSFFRNFVYSIVDETYIFEKKRLQNLFINLIISELKELDYEPEDFIELFSSCNDEIRFQVERKLSSEPINVIELLISETKSNREREPENSYIYGSYLYNNTFKHVELLSKVSNTEAYSYTSLMDSLASEIHLCGISLHRNLTSENIYEQCLELYQNAMQFALSEELKAKIWSNIESLKNQERLDSISNELDLLMSLMKAFSSREVSTIAEVNLFLKGARPLLMEVEGALNENDYLILSDAVVNIALDALIFIVNSEQNKFNNKIQGAIFKSNLRNNLLDIINETLSCFVYISNFDMTHQVRDRFNENHNIIMDTSNSLSRSNESSVGLIGKWIIFIAVAFFIIKACG